MDPSLLTSGSPLAHDQLSAQNATSTNSRPQLSRQQWEDYKPMIERLYINENKTLAYIANALAVSHSFRPTKKQFTSKITEWGLRKNFKRSERSHVLKSLGPLEGDIRIDLTGRKFKKKRLLRWDKEKMKERTESSRAPYASVLASDNVAGHCSPESSTRTMSWSPYPPMDLDPDYSLTEPEPARRVWVREDEGEEYKLLPHAEWINADVLRSPKLTRLLDGLAIETKYLEDDIEPLTLSIEPKEINIKSITWSDLTSGSSSAVLLISDETSFPGSLETKNRPTSNFARHRLTNVTPKSFKYADVDVLSPSGIQVSREPSPFDEIYAFPTCGTTARQKSFATLSRSRQNATDQLVNQLTLLGRAGICESHPAVVELTNRLADAAYEIGNMTQANSMYRKVLACQGGDIMTWSEKALHAQVALIDGLCREGHPLEAKEMLEGVSTAMVKRFDPTHVIFRQLQKARIEIFNWMEDWDQEEPITRDLVQICLVHLGPRDPETLNAVYRLASVMMGQKRYSESEKLHRMTIQLCQEGTEKHHERRCWSSTGLGRVYENEGRLDDAINLLTKSAERASETLGVENEAVMIQNYRLARILARRGCLEESEKLLLETLSLQTKVLGEAHINPMCTMFELGFTLLQQKNYQQSAIWLEKCFRKSLSLSNFEFITRFCKGLGECYEEQGRYVEALGIYHEAMDFLRTAKKKSDDELFDVEQYVVKIQRLIDGACEHIKEVRAPDDGSVALKF